jgi:hypothetical protein
MLQKSPLISLRKQEAHFPFTPKGISSNKVFFTQNLLENDCSLNQLQRFRLPQKLFHKKYCLLLVALFLVIFSSAQMTAPYTVNVAGNQVTRGNYAIEWSVGESAAINIMDNSDLFVFTNGLLQYNVENQTEINKIASFYPMK